MAAIDPTAQPEAGPDGTIPPISRSTLRIVKQSIFAGSDDEEDNELNDEELEALLGEASDDDEMEPNGGPSDPAKSKKQKDKAAIQKLMAATKDDDSEEDSEDEEMADAKPNGIAKSKKSKGKAKVTAKDLASESDESEDDSDGEGPPDGFEGFVLCTLDTTNVSRVLLHNRRALGFCRIANLILRTALPATFGHYSPRRRASFLHRQRYSLSILDRQLYLRRRG